MKRNILIFTFPFLLLPALGLSKIFAVSTSNILHDNFADPLVASTVASLIALLPVALSGLISYVLIIWGIRKMKSFIFSEQKITLPEPDVVFRSTSEHTVPLTYAPDPFFINPNSTSTKLSLEQMNELSSGWKIGDRLLFDSAMITNDKLKIESMIIEKRVPKEYQDRFEDKINSILNTKSL